MGAPVFAPFDNTQFAPTLNFGSLITLEPIVRGLVSPLKGVTAPGEPNWLYVVDQTGQIWRIDIGPGATLPRRLDAAAERPVLHVPIAVLSFGEDAAGEVYATGNVQGIPFGTGDVVMRLAPFHNHGDHDHDDD